MSHYMSGQCVKSNVNMNLACSMVGRKIEIYRSKIFGYFKLTGSSSSKGSKPANPANLKRFRSKSTTDKCVPLSDCDGQSRLSKHLAPPEQTPVEKQEPMPDVHSPRLGPDMSMHGARATATASEPRTQPHRPQSSHRNSYAGSSAPSTRPPSPHGRVPGRNDDSSNRHCPGNHTRNKRSKTYHRSASRVRDEDGDD